MPEEGEVGVSSQHGPGQSLVWGAPSLSLVTVLAGKDLSPSLSVSSSEFRCEFCLQKGNHSSRSRRDGVNAHGGGRDWGGETSGFVA